ncbi:unnamed protein product [Sphenostylis stenocarpa]|uniref:Disease resistance protein At4g27190-like leucine-rich repeats domain-containing protein n=1 Tax=Sphenostylis stenocarpa TaxID=92480 RepID=A0AA86T784_9FABA|nr:unnamed protein product [Sphenostylis stenocarpa]
MEEQGSNRELAPFNLGISDLKLVNLPNLNFIWEGPTVYLSLQKLGSICVNGCPKLKIIFSTTIVRSLPMLTSLVITNSGELAQIFDIVDAQELKSLSCLQQVCFPSLSTISIKKCNKLEWLFYDLSATHFTHLTKLEIEECSQLHKVFAFEHEADGGGEEGTGKVEEQVLQKLRDIRLKNLPKFKEIHHGFKLEDDVEQTLEDCPKYSPSLYLHSGLLDPDNTAPDWHLCFALDRSGNVKFLPDVV